MSKRLALLVACAAFIPGCEPSGTGDVTVVWSVGLTGSCGDASLQYVTAHLETTDGILVARRDEFCSAGSVGFRDIPVGSYRIRLVAFDEAGIDAYEAAVRDVTVLDGIENGPYLGRLAPRPARLGLVWFFDGGRLCSAYDVTRVRIELFQDDALDGYAESPCDRGETVVEDLRPGTYDLRVDGENSRRDVTHSFTLAGVVLRPGHRVDVEAALMPCGDHCF